MLLPRTLPALLVVSIFVLPARADDEFESKVRPLLAKHCGSCHFQSVAKKLKGGLSLDGRDVMLKGGNSGPAIVPGDPDKSLLIRAIRYEDLEFPMPPKGKMPAEAIATLERWVKNGAPGPNAAVKSTKPLAEIARTHWSLQPLRRATTPAVRDVRWIRNPIDAFVLARLDAAGSFPGPGR